MLDAKQIANWFIQRAQQDDRTLSIMTILKLIYISHGWHLEIFKSPLIRNRIEAWKFGPVVPDAYYAFRGQGVSVPHPVKTVEFPLDDGKANLLEEIYQIYSQMGAFKLSEITHVPDGPWDVASKQGGFFAEIPNSIIQDHYERLRATANQEA